jgi:hypothetical protein
LVGASIVCFGLGCCSFRGGGSQMDGVTARCPDLRRAGVPCFGRRAALSLSLALSTSR